MTLCGADYCRSCPRLNECGGCKACNGRPLGGLCVAAELIKALGFDGFLKTKEELIKEINVLGIPELYVDNLNLLHGYYVNLEYALPSGKKVKLLNDNSIYFGNQIERKSNKRCYGVVADTKFILVVEYEINGEKPEIIMYKKR